MDMFAAVALLFAGFGVTLMVLFFAFVGGIAAGERVGATQKITTRR
jgi:hypothetical protein